MFQSHHSRKLLQHQVRLLRQVLYRQRLPLWSQYLHVQVMVRGHPLQAQRQVSGFLPWHDALPMSIALI